MIIEDVHWADESTVDLLSYLGAVTCWLRRTGSGRPPRGGELAGPYQAELTGDWTAAAQQWLDLGCPYDAALALLDAPDEVALRKALDLLTDLGAEAAAQIARQRLRSLGVRSIPAGPRAAPAPTRCG